MSNTKNETKPKDAKDVPLQRLVRRFADLKDWLPKGRLIRFVHL